jgi:hypothetical protein
MNDYAKDVRGHGEVVRVVWCDTSRSWIKDEGTGTEICEGQTLPSNIDY